MSDFFTQLTTAGKPTSSEHTVISRDTVISGHISGDGALTVDGVVKGNIFCRSTLELTGKVEGNISATEITITSGIIKGDITSEGDVVVLGNSVIVGNIKGKNIEFNGKIKGNISVEGSAVLQDNSVVQGNITAKKFTADEGTKIMGFVEIIRSQDMSAETLDEDIEKLLDFGTLSQGPVPDMPAVAEKSTVVQQEKQPSPPQAPIAPPPEPVPPPVEIVAEKPEPPAPTKPTVADTIKSFAQVMAKTQPPEPKEEKVPAPIPVPDLPQKKETDEDEGVVTGMLEASEDVKSKGEGFGIFADEKQKMLKDLRSRMERAKRGGV